ncbi:alpha/beta fold hydrolase [Thalassospira marina]|uniref:Alpha/beta hydrolase n=1 Tax=Thalassospira marina TaxID=2048283 RepID=A0ABM6QEM6_9PROT|nr:alpha/beta hydrolase [Thalassospira marina]AUG55006.1 alpha/beta hydrolase [Thalassospira marina]
MPEPTLEYPLNESAQYFDFAAFWQKFQSRMVRVDGVSLHYVEGGTGAPVLLIPGWPQSWFAWRFVMQELVKAGRHVIAIDPRGMGDSDHPSSGYDMTTIANEIRAFLDRTGLLADGAIDVVGHDIGTWIAYALAADHGDAVKSLAVFDGALPGITPPPPAGIPSEAVNVKTWHFAFNRLDDLPEILITGRERAFLGWLFGAKSTQSHVFDRATMDEYVRVNTRPGALRAALAYYKTAFSPAAMEDAAKRATRHLAMPVMAFGAEYGVGPVLKNTLADIADHCAGGVLAGIGHYIPEECPATVSALLGQFWTDHHA